MKKQTIEEACTLHARIGWQGLTKAEYLNAGDFFLVTGVDFVDGFIDFEHCHFVTKDRYDQDEHIQLKIDDVLVTKDGTIGKVAIIDQLDKPATLNSGVFVVRPKNKDALLPEYLVFALRSGHFSRFIEQIKVGCTIAHLNQAKFLKYEIPQIDMDEQKRVIDVLKRAESVVKARQQELNKLDELIKARFVEMFGDCKSEALIGDNVSICRGASPRPIQSYITDEEDGVNWIKIGDVSDDSLYITKTAEKITIEGSMKSRAVHKGDFILSNSMSFGRPYILGIDGCVHDGWLILSDFRDCFDELYLYHALRSEHVQHQFSGKVNGATVKNLNSDLVKSTSIIVPEMEKQKEFADFVKQVDKSKVVVQQALDKARLLFDSLMQEYFG